MPSKSHKFENLKNSLIVFGLIILLIGCFLCAVIAPFALEIADRVAYADSSNGVVEDNIFTVSTFEGLSGSTSSSMQLGTSGWYLSGAGSTTRSFSDNVLSSSAYAVSSVYAQIITSISNPLQYAGQTLTFSCYGEVVSYDFLLQVWYNDTGVSTTSLGSTGYNVTSRKSLSFTVPSTITSSGTVRVMVQTRGSVRVDWVKLELGSSFTGYVPNSFKNYGYDQGVEFGSTNAFDLRGFQYLDNLSLNSRNIGDFTLDGHDYTLSNWSEDTESLGWYNAINFAMVETIEDEEYIGGVYRNPNLFGHILITLPFVNDIDVDLNYTVMFEDTVTLDRLYTSPSDTVHWSLVTTFGYINNNVNMPVNAYLINYFSENPVNVYFIGNSSGSLATALTHSYMWYPVNYQNFNIYATQNNIALSYDEGYLIGYNQAYSELNSQISSSYNQGYSQGFSAGEIKGASQANNYTFLGVIGAVIDAPIQGLKGLLNFELLGTNMQSFVLALLTLAVIVFILRLMLGGK